VGALKKDLVIKKEIFKSAADKAPEDEEHPSTYPASFEIFIKIRDGSRLAYEFLFGIGVELFHTFSVDYSKVPSNKFQTMRRSFHPARSYQSLSFTAAMRATESAELEFWVEVGDLILSKSDKVKANLEEA